MRTQREVRSLTADEERRLRAHIEGNALRAEQTHAWHPVRAQAIIETFLGSGLRISELAALLSEVLARAPSRDSHSSPTP